MRHYTECPWPRLPVAGDKVYLPASDIFVDIFVTVREVSFDLVGNVVVELEPERIMEDLLSYVGELTALGFVETHDPCGILEDSGQSACA